MSDLMATARSLVAQGRGILAADESTATITKRLAAVGVESSEQTRREYRDLLLGAPGVESFLSGVILYDETIRQRGRDDAFFVERLRSIGVHPGIKVDLGTEPLEGSPDETITRGLDGLSSRLVEYRDMGARFAKWRAVIHIGDGRPTRQALEANAFVLARYAKACQEVGLVPIVEPEVLMDGDHSIETCFDVTERTLHTVFEALWQHDVALEGMLLKPNMVIAGKGCAEQAPPDVVASETLRCLRRTVPAAVPGIVFLSGGQSAAQATHHLSEMNHEAQPWQLSFSYGRALQDEALRAWAGDDAKVDTARKVFLRRGALTAAARSGSYDPSEEAA
ncbi:MAG: class I fructose-bisphosphate aldolase [Candidatus Eisenbacteria bacterium]